MTIMNFVTIVTNTIMTIVTNIVDTYYHVVVVIQSVELIFEPLLTQ